SADARLASRGGRMRPPLRELFLVQQDAFGLLRVYWAVEELVVFEEDLDEGGARGDGALDQRLRQRVFDVLLQGAAQRARTVAAVGEGLVENPLLGIVRNRDRDGFLRQVLVELRDYELENLDQVALAQRQEQDDFVEAVEELRVEGAFDFALHQFFHLVRDHVFLRRLEAQALALLQVPRADVRGHDDDRVLEVDGVAEAVGQLAVFKDLQQDVEHIRVRLLDFVEQDHRVGGTLHALGELAALFVAHVSRRRTDELRDRVLLHELGHVEADEGFFSAEHKLRQSARDFDLADARGAQEQERADGAVGILQAGAGTADGARQGADGLVLRDDALVQLFLDAQQFLRLFFFDRGDRHSGPARDYVFDVFAVDYSRGRLVEMIFFAKATQVLALFALFVGVEASFFEFVIRDGVFHAMHDELNALLDFGQLFRQRSLAQFYTGSGFVDQVNCLVGQETVRDVAVGMRDREIDRFVGVSDRVEFLVAIFNAEKNLDRVDLIRRRNFHGLEATLKRTVFLDRLAVFAGGGSADALDFATRQRGLQNVGGVERTFRRSGADQRVQFVDEDDGVLRLHQFLHDGLEALFELAAVLGAGNDERQVQGKDALVGEKRRNFAVGDALGQSFDDGGLAHTGLADQAGIVLGPAAEDLDDTINLPFATDQGVQLAVHGGLGQIARKFRQQRTFTLALRLSFFLRAASEFFADGREAQAALVQDLGGEALLFSQ